MKNIATITLDAKTTLIGVGLTETGKGFETTSGFAKPCTANAADHKTI